MGAKARTVDNKTVYSGRFCMTAKIQGWIVSGFFGGGEVKGMFCR